MTKYEVEVLVISPLPPLSPDPQTGDRVEYRPIGGGTDNVSHSTGEIVDVTDKDGVCYSLVSSLSPLLMAFLGSALCYSK
jgi:hypothetical protein